MKRITRVAIVVLAIFGPGLAFSAWYYQVYSWNDFEIYRAMSKECHPVWREFNFRRISPGADLDDVIKTTKPRQVERYGDFVQLNYQFGFTGVSATAYKGRLVSAYAGSCCWVKCFFDVTTKPERSLLDAEVEVFMKPTRERWAREVLEERFVASAIVAAPWCLP